MTQLPPNPVVAPRPNRIKELRKARGWTQERLAEMVHITTGQISRYEAGKAEIPLGRLQKIADALGCRLTQLLFDSDEEAPPESNAVPFQMEGASAERMREDLPIFGTALGASRVYEGEAVEQTMLNTGEIVHYAKRPVILNGRADAYGLYVQGQSMEPVHMEGDLILAETKRPARNGDDVIVYLRPDDENDDGARARCVLLKRLIGRKGGMLHLQQFNPPRDFQIPMDDALRVDRVLRLPDLIG